MNINPINDILVAVALITHRRTVSVDGPVRTKIKIEC
jgi:hypothetical protein